MLVIQHEDNYYQIGTVPPDQIGYFSNDFHVVFLSRAGTPFCDTTKVDNFNPQKNLEAYRPSEEYIENCGIDWEVRAMSAVLDTILTFLPNSGNEVAAVGISEGGRIVAKLAVEDDRITHLACVVSGGLNQFYSSIINRRLDAASGILTHEEAQDQIDELYETYRQIYSEPKSTDKWYYGHPYKRWGSFCNDLPLEHLVKLEIPICLVNGSKDRSSPILQADYIMLEFIRLGKNNLTYYALPGMDHQFYKTVITDGKEEHVSMRNEVFAMIGDWINKY
jgi:esterase/lipase